MKTKICGLSPVVPSDLSDALYAELLAEQRKRDDHGWENSKLVEVCRRMTPEQKLKAAARMFWDARRARAQAIQQEHMAWSKDEVELELRRLMLAEAFSKKS
jgi:hypothetical protein